MLILAGVSLNAIVGDNGIITNAQNANMKNGMAILEEYLQQKYVENFENFTSDDTNKVAKLSALYNEYFYNPQDDGFGTVNYILDAEGHALYLVNKSGLPEDIQDSLQGGNCGYGLTGIERYTAFVSLDDVYGVTSDLKVYYSSGQGSFMGIASKDDLDDDTTSRVVLNSASALAKAAKSDGTDVTVADTQSVRNLVVDENSGATSLSDLYVFGSLENLTLKNLKLNNLDGIQTALKLNYVYFQNCEIGDYSSLAKVSKLKYLYFYSIDDNELNLICNGIKNANYPYLRYFAAVGSQDYISDTRDVTSGSRKVGVKYITNLNPIGTLSSTCIGNVEYLNLQCNEITNTVDEQGKTKYALENLVLFNNLYFLRVERNALTSLKGLENNKKIVYLYVSFNKLGQDETYTSLTTVVDDQTGLEREATDEDRGKNETNSIYALQYLENLYLLKIEGNVDLKWVGYLKYCTKIGCLYFGDGLDETISDINMVDTEVASIRTIIKNCGGYKSYPGKYWLSLLDETDTALEVNLDSQTITKSQFESLGTYKNIKYLNLKNLKIIGKDEENNDYLINNKDEINMLITSVLKNITNLQYLNVDSTVPTARNEGTSLYNLNDLSFIKGVDLTNSEDDILLREIRASNTLLSTQEQDEEGVWKNYNNGLILLDEKRVGSDEIYGKNMGCLIISEEHINLGDMNQTTKLLVERRTASNFGRDYYGLIAIMNKAKIISSISNCVGLERVLLMSGLGAADTKLDLSNNTSLTYFNTHWGYENGEVILPMSCSEVSLHIWETSGRIKFAGEGTPHITELTMNSTKRAGLISFLSQLPAGTIIDRIQFRVSNVFDGVDNTDLDFFEEVYNARNSKLQIKGILLSYTSTKLKSLKGLEYIDGLETIDTNGYEYLSLSDISALKYHASTMREVTLKNTAISDTSVFVTFSNLKHLDLRNCCLQFQN